MKEAGKKAFDLRRMLSLIETAISGFPKAAMFQLFEEGYSTLFEQLVSCVVSIRTLDETTIPVSKKLFARARTAKEMLRIPVEELTTLLNGSTFPGQKAATIRAIAEVAAKTQDGSLPLDYDFLTSIKGVGPKCANLALGVAGGQAAISVDIHVHRVTNRWGLLQTASPEATMKALELIVAKESWIDINRLLMPFGKFICTGVRPHCSTCPVLSYCRQVGVRAHR